MLTETGTKFAATSVVAVSVGVLSAATCAKPVALRLPDVSVSDDSAAADANALTVIVAAVAAVVLSDATCARPELLSAPVVSVADVTALAVTAPDCKDDVVTAPAVTGPALSDDAVAAPVLSVAERTYPAVVTLAVVIAPDVSAPVLSVAERTKPDVVTLAELRAPDVNDPVVSDMVVAEPAFKLVTLVAPDVSVALRTAPLVDKADDVSAPALTLAAFSRPATVTLDAVIAPVLTEPGEKFVTASAVAVRVGVLSEAA